MNRLLLLPIVVARNNGRSRIHNFNAVVRRSFSSSLLSVWTSSSSTTATTSYEHCQFTSSSPSPGDGIVSASSTAARRRGRQQQNLHPYSFHQVRWRRHDRASATNLKPRPKTKKQRQSYNRRMKRLNDEESRWNPPGSKAGPKRQWAQDRWNQLLDIDTTAAIGGGGGADPTTTTTTTTMMSDGRRRHRLLAAAATDAQESDGSDVDALGSNNSSSKELLLSSTDADADADDGRNEDEEYTLEDALVEEMMFNTSHVTSQPTPQPTYYGHRHKKYYNRVANKMDRYQDAITADMTATADDETETAGNDKNGLIDVTDLKDLLPTDQDVSLVLRAYRDRHGTRAKPIGIVTALKHILQDLKVPTSTFGEKTFTTLLTCCRTPKEGRRIFQLIHENGHDVSPYSWSILVDIHAKNGDYEGCATVLKEMASVGGHAPTMAAYTSLLAACYKVCSNHGRFPHAVRAHAGKVGWEHWQEMFIVGIEPDAMAYGAILRLCSARGHPERAVSLLEDMQRFGVKPTTLCFTAALRAVAKSHETSIRFENGSSRKQLRRETIAAHHGKMARSIVVMAEQAEVEQDDGFVSALMLCAAAAGDSPTTKAVYLASEVRRMNQFQPIVAASQLSAGKNDDLLLDEDASSSTNMLDSTTGDVVSNTIPNQLVAANQSSSSASLTSSGQNNKNTMNAVVPFGEREYGKDTRTLSALLHASSQAMNKNGMGTIWAGRDNLGYLCDNSLRLITTRWEPSYRNTQIPGTDSTKVGIGALKRLDDIERETEPKPGKRKKFRGLCVDDEDILTIDDIDIDDNNDEDGPNASDNVSYANQFEDDEDDDDFFRPSTDDDTFEKADTFVPITKTHEPRNESGDTKYSEEEVFAKFLSEIKEEAAKNGQEFDLSDDEARELFEMTMEEFEGDNDVENEEEDIEMPEDFDRFLAEMKKEAKNQGQDADFEEAELREFYDLMKDENSKLGDVPDEDVAAHARPVEGEDRQINDLQSELVDNDVSSSLAPSNLDSDQDPVAVVHETGLDPKLAGLSQSQIAKVEELQIAIPGLPVGRAKRIIQTFEGTLGAPSLLSLVPHLRENMPGYVSSSWLKRTNISNAEFAMGKAIEDGVVDISLMNSMLEAKCSAGSIDEALAYHEEFSAHKLNPNAYSDRLVVQMLLDCNRQSRALKFKEDIESNGRTLDLAGYGSFIQYYSRRNRLGPSLMLLNECMSVHKAPPSEFYLSQLRVLCRQNGVEDEVGLQEMVGEDPIAWLKHGERFLRREKSKKGNRDINRAYNRALG
mmetsp:Transcript_49387/g.119784  ORF Transcript_49387/g.119784 Transcript_49387/m.119784 type:complete len:1278 (-) Transcript_49387:110-3943(-)